MCVSVDGSCCLLFPVELVGVLEQVVDFGDGLLGEPVLERKLMRQTVEVVALPHVNLSLLAFSQVKVKSEHEVTTATASSCCC